MGDAYTYKQIAIKYEVSIDTAKVTVKKYGIKSIGHVRNAKTFDCIEIDGLFSKEFSLNQTTKEGMITIPQIIREQGFSRAEIKKRVKLSNIIPLRQHNNAFFTIEMYAKLTDDKFHFKTIWELSKIYGIEKAILKKLVINNKLGKPIKYHEGSYYDPIIFMEMIPEIEKSIKENDAKGEQFKKFKISMVKNKEASYNEIIEEGLNYFNKDLIESKKYAREFLNYRVGNLKLELRRIMAVGYINTINKLSFITNNEEFADVSNVIFEGIVKSDEISDPGKKLYLSFFRYIKDVSTRVCKYNTDYLVEVELSGKSSKEMYSKDEWLKLFEYINNIDIHVNLAIKNSNYAKAWLFVMAHLFLSWRKMSFSEIPAPNINQIEIKDIMDFDIQKITLAEAQFLIEDIKEQCESLNASKNQRKLTFIRPILHLGLSFGVSLAIVEMHRKMGGSKDDKPLDYGFCKHYPEKLDKLRFFDKFEIPGFVFRSLKANRSLQTFEFEIASKMPGTLAISLDIVGAGRSHKPDVTGCTKTTVEYICLTKGDGRTLDELSVALLTMGFFGFLYKEILIIMTNGKSLELDFDEENKLMTLVKKAMSPQEAETILDYLQCQRDRKRPITDRLIKLDNSKLKRFLEKIVKQKCPSKEEGVQCLNYCEFPTSRECRGCENSILTIPTVFQIKADILDIISKIKKTPSDRINELKKYSYELFRFLELATEFREQFRLLGDDFINRFWDWEDIKNDVMELYESGKLLGGDY